MGESKEKPLRNSANTRNCCIDHMMIRSPLLALFLAACTAVPPAQFANTPRALPTEIPPGAYVQVPLEAAGTPEAIPLLVIRSSIMDEETERPVRGDVYVVDSVAYREPEPYEQHYAGVDAFELALFGDINAWLIVKAPGNETWRLRLSFNLKTSRELTGPVRLRKVAGEGQ